MTKAKRKLCLSVVLMPLVTAVYHYSFITPYGSQTNYCSKMQNNKEMKQPIRHC